MKFTLKLSFLLLFLYLMVASCVRKSKAPSKPPSGSGPKINLTNTRSMGAKFVAVSPHASIIPAKPSGTAVSGPVQPKPAAAVSKPVQSKPAAAVSALAQSKPAAAVSKPVQPKPTAAVSALAQSKPAAAVSEPVQPKPVSAVLKPIRDKYVEKREDLYFVMEHRTHNPLFWREFVNKNNEISNRISHLPSDTQQLVWNSSSALTIFHNNLCSRNNYELWIAYVAVKPVSDSGITERELEYKDIEMAVTVSTAEGLPFTSHMGIFRTLTFLQRRHKDQLHKGISLPLHAFAARTMLKLYPKKVYMIFAPEESMIRILEKALPKTAFMGNNRMNNSYPSCVKKEEGGDIVIFDQSSQEIGRLSKWEEQETWFPDISAPHIAIDLNQLANAR